jgi:peptide/nickel transport system ATP-binding protein
MMADRADRDMIEVKGLRVVAGAAPGPVIEIVKGVDFSVKKGEVLALIEQPARA